MIEKPRVFISHSAIDTWVARQVVRHIEACGAESFLDEADVEHGDDFEQKILAAAQDSSELLVLLTPWALTRPWIWLEIGAFWGSGKRIVAVLHGLTAKEIANDERLPLNLKRTDLVALNDLESYFAQLRRRVEATEASDVTS